MRYCDQCGNEVSYTDKRCSKCGNKLTSEPPIGTPKDDWIGSIRSPEYHNIEFILAIIAIILTVLSIPSSINDYSFTYNGFLIYVLISLFVAVIGTIVIRYHAKIGAIILLIASFSLIFFGLYNMYLALIFFIMAAILAFIR